MKLRLVSNVCDSNVCVKYMVHNSCANHSCSDITVLITFLPTSATILPLPLPPKLLPMLLLLVNLTNFTYNNAPEFHVQRLRCKLLQSSWSRLQQTSPSASSFPWWPALPVGARRYVHTYLECSTPAHGIYWRACTAALDSQYWSLAMWRSSHSNSTTFELQAFSADSVFV